MILTTITGSVKKVLGASPAAESKEAFLTSAFVSLWLSLILVKAEFWIKIIHSQQTVTELLASAFLENGLPGAIGDLLALLLVFMILLFGGYKVYLYILLNHQRSIMLVFYYLGIYLLSSFGVAIYRPFYRLPWPESPLQNTIACFP